MNPAILSVPAHKSQWLESARLSGAWVMWDLEDGVPDEYKDDARRNVVDLAINGDLIRVNSGERFDEDCCAVRRTGATPVYPKVSYECEDVTCGVIIELVRTVEKIDVLLDNCDPSVVLFGWVDLLADSGLTPESRWFLDDCRSRVVLACRARGIPVYDGPPLGDAATEAERARRQGFSGMGCIHPKQVRVVRETFRSQTVAEGEFLRQIRVYGDAIPKPLQEIASRC